VFKLLRRLSELSPLLKFSILYFELSAICLVILVKIGFSHDISFVVIFGFTALFIMFWTSLIYFLMRFRWIQVCFQIMGIIMFTAVAVLLVSELSLRYYFDHYGTQREKLLYLYSIEQLREIHPMRPVPNLDYIPYPSLNSDINSLGYRGLDEYPIPKPQGTIRIVVMGDSTTYGNNIRADETHPMYLQQVLREDYGYSQVEVVNAGVPGHNSYHMVANLAFRIPELDPDFLILHVPTNDIQQRRINSDCYRGINPHRGLDARFATYSMNADVSLSALYRFLDINLGGERPGSFDFLHNPIIDCVQEPSLPFEEAFIANPPIFFQRNLETFIVIANRFDIPILLSTLVYDFDSDRNSYFYHGLLEHNEVIRDVATSNNVHLVDLAQSELAAQSIYWDRSKHQTAEGNLLQAQLYARYIVENKLIPPFD